MNEVFKFLIFTNTVLFERSMFLILERPVLFVQRACEKNMLGTLWQTRLLFSLLREKEGRKHCAP